VTGHNRVGADYCTALDVRALQDSDSSAEPHVFFDYHTPIDHRLIAHQLSRPGSVVSVSDAAELAHLCVRPDDDREARGNERIPSQLDSRSNAKGAPRRNVQHNVASNDYGRADLDASVRTVLPPQPRADAAAASITAAERLNEQGVPYGVEARTSQSCPRPKGAES
jgi:hypothetical protein